MQRGDARYQGCHDIPLCSQTPEDKLRDSTTSFVRKLSLLYRLHVLLPRLKGIEQFSDSCVWGSSVYDRSEFEGDQSWKQHRGKEKAKDSIEVWDQPSSSHYDSP